ncbi:MAG: hypothetical protein QG662_76 [Pseudomonadota bacterium]|nr:hypothetical protein [Pseudomonadota bacterium]
MFAAQEGHANVVQILLERGANPNLIDSHGSSAWTYARDAHQLKILALLWPKLDLQKRRGEADLALYISAEDGYLDIVEFLWGKVSGESALSGALAGAAGNGRLDVAKFLVEHGAAITGGTLSRAVQHSTPDKLNVLRYLLDNGADPDVRYTQQGVGIGGMTPLMLASYLNYYPEAWGVMALLLGYGADLDAKDDRGKTALDIARDYSKLESIRFLKTAGEFAAGRVVDADSGKPVEGAVVSLDFWVRKSGEERQRRLIQQSLTGANGRFYVHTWQNPVRREAGWELVPAQKPEIRIYAQGYQRLIAGDRFGIKKGGGPNIDQPIALKPMLSTPAALLRELALWKEGLTSEVFDNSPDYDYRTHYRTLGNLAGKQERIDAQKHLTLLFGSVCETLPSDARAQTCYQPCSDADALVQKYKLEAHWEKERRMAVAKAARDGTPIDPVSLINTGCGYKVTSSDGKSILLVVEGPWSAETRRTALENKREIMSRRSIMLNMSWDREYGRRGNSQ